MTSPAAGSPVNVGYNVHDDTYPSRSSSEKGQAAYIDKIHDVDSPVTPTYDEKVLRRALWKLDLFLLPVVTLGYLLNFLDRANIGNAKAAGMLEDLHMNSKQYSIALTVTYVPYIVAEFPITMLIKILGPDVLMPILVCSWGIVTTLQGLVTSYSGLLAARFFLGMCEGALLPSSITYFNMFYRRKDLAKRIAFFFTATSLAGAFSGLLAAALLNMHGLGGKPGWSWIFIIEGLLTVTVGFLSYFALARSPATARYLSHEERKNLVAALDADRPPAEEHVKMTAREVLSTFKSPHMWLMCIQLFASGTCLFSMAYFAPTIVGGLGYKGTQIQLMSVPPYAASTVFSLICCYTSDHIANRGAFVVLAGLISAGGYIMYLVSTDKHVLYGSLFLMIIGAYTSAPLVSTWMPNNLAPFYKRTTGIVMGFIFTNSGGILSTWLFPGKEAPRYHKGTSVLLAMSLCMPVFALLNTGQLYLENKRRAKLRDAGHVDDVQAGEIGDRSVNFKLIY